MDRFFRSKRPALLYFSGIFLRIHRSDVGFEVVLQIAQERFRIAAAFRDGFKAIGLMQQGIEEMFEQQVLVAHAVGCIMGKRKRNAQFCAQRGAMTHMVNEILDLKER